MGKAVGTILKVGALVAAVALAIPSGGTSLLAVTLGVSSLAASAIAIGLSIGATLLSRPRGGGGSRAAAAAQLQLGEQPRQAIFGRAAVGGTLVDAFNYGGKYGTDWEVMVIALADHRCDALEGVFVDDTFVAYTGDGDVPGFNGQLRMFWRAGTWGQEVPWILTDHGPGWTANDRGWGIAYAVVAYKSDASDAKNPVWPSGRPRFRWVVRGLRCYQARKDSTVGGSGAHRWNDPATWEWTENPIDIRHNWVRGIYAGDMVAQPEMLLVGRGLSAIEAPPANVFPRANLCDEVVGGQPRYRIGGMVASIEPFIDVESDFAAAVAGTISQPEGAVEVDPGQAKAVVATFTDADLLVGSTVTWNEQILGQQDDSWINTVAARFVDPGQRWAVRSAPVRRETADIVADGAPREAQPQLDLVTNQPQAQRIAEVIRRLGRLWGRATVTLPPRFAYIEEGDWVQWQSDRQFGGATLTFRVEAWGSNPAWHHQLTLRQISLSVYSDTAPLSDGVIASTRAPPPVVAAPAVGVWNAAAVLLGSGSVRVPNLRVAGTADDPAAQFVVFEYVPQAAAPDVATIWTFASSSRPDIRLLDIPVPEGGTYYVAISYVVDGIQGARRVLGPITVAALSYGDGSPIAPVAPANANRVPFSRMEGGRGYGVLFNPSGLAGPTDYGDFQGQRFFRLQATATAAGQQISIGHAPATVPTFRLTPSERISVQARVEAQGAAPPNGWAFAIWGFRIDGSQLQIGTASGVGARVIGTGFVQFFVNVPNDVIGGRLEVYGFSGGAGLLQVVISEPMVTSAAAGQTVHPPFSPGPNASDGATLGAPNGTPVGGVLAEALVAQAAQAAADATAANAAAFAANLAIANITSDNILSRDEKAEIRKQRDEIINERPTIRARAVAYGVAVGNYDADYTALIAYLGGLDLGGATDTAITRSTFNMFFTDYFADRQIVLDGIAAAASNANVSIGPDGILNGIGTANIRVNNALVPLGNSNRVPLSRMEGDRGYGVLFNPSALVAPTDYSIFDGMRFFRAQVTATAAGQQLSIGHSPATVPTFRLTAGERVSVQARIETSGAAANGWLYSLWGFRANGTSYVVASVNGANRNIGTGFVQFFADIPSDVVGGRLEVYGYSASAGDFQVVISEPMVTNAAAGQTVHPPFSPGPNASDGADPNNLINISGGNLNGIGPGNGTPVDNTRNLLRDTLTNLPATGVFVGQQFSAINTGDVLRWSGSAWVSVADITGTINGPADITLNYASDLTLTSPLPVTGTYQLVLAGGGAVSSGVSWAVTVISGSFTSTAPTMVGTGSGQLRINSAMTSPEAQLRITATVGGKTYPGFTAKVSRNVAAPSNSGGGSGSSAPATGALTSINSSSFSRMHASDLTVTLGSGVTSVALVASGDLVIDPVTPTGSTTVEGKWQRENSPGTWTDVGSAATSSPLPNVYDAGLLDGLGNPVYAADPGSISCNASATGLSGGSTQKFRFMARVSGGNVRNVTGSGNVSATA